MATLSSSLFRNARVGTVLVANPSNKLVHKASLAFGRPGCVEWREGSRSLVSAPGDLPEQAVKSSKPKPKMTFEEYRKLRKRIRTISRLPGLIVGLSGFTASCVAAFLFNPDMLQTPPEEIQLILGMDPIFMTVLASTGSGIVGYLFGGSICSSLWRSRYKELNQWEEDFLKMLQRHRYDEINKFDDDYYGDKIMTLSDYRQWIRKQHKKRDSMKLKTPSQSTN